MLAFILLAITGGIAIGMEFMLWKLFSKSATQVHYSQPLVPKWVHVSKPSRMALLAVLHLAFTLAMLVIAYLFLW